MIKSRAVLPVELPVAIIFSVGLQMISGGYNMKILVLSGSPRKTGKTGQMVAAFKDGAESAGHEVVIHDVGRMKIGGCLACEYCHTKGEGTCIQKDDMQKIYPDLYSADAIVFASPIYYFTMTAQIEDAIQRFYPTGTIDNIKKCALILCSASPGVYSASEAQVADMSGYMGWEQAGVVTVCGADEIAPEKIQEAFDLGKNM